MVHRFTSSHPAGQAGTGGLMPLVRSDLLEGRTSDEARRIADVIQEVMLDVFAAPPRDRYQVITEPPVGHIIAEDTGLNFERTDCVLVIQIVQQGRSEDQKRAVYADLARRLEADCNVAPTDLIVSIVANGRQDWSFGLGRAQFLDGDL
jgi:phenylpyruvate tautomerase PptA (4-oxalocrotonate tautomerase family)